MVAWAWKHRSHPRRLIGCEARRAHAEIVARRRFGSEHVFAPLGDVEIDLENAVLVHRRLEHCGEYRFLALAQRAALTRKKQVLRELLGERRPPGDDSSAPQVSVHRPLDAFPVEALVIDELRV